MNAFGGYAGLVAPRYATPRNHARATYGAHDAAVAEMLGWPLLPWQRYIADVAGEVDDAGVHVYDTIIVTVPRQAGKTTLAMARNVRQCVSTPGTKAWYTAQTGQHASENWREMVTGVWSESPLDPLAKPRLSNGSAALRFTNHSEFRPHPPTADSLHGKQSDLNNVDEAWSFTQVEWKGLMGAIVPTQLTRKKLRGQQPQTWIFSTEGTSESIPFNELLDRNRATQAENVALFDWGVPADEPLPDITDPRQLAGFFDVVYRCHPGAGYLFERADLPGFFEQLDRDISEFARAFGNRRTGATARVIPEADWNTAATTDPIPDDAPVCFGAAVGRDGEDATITVTALLPDGHKVTEVIRHGAGTVWILDALKELTEKWDAPVVIDRAGPSTDLHDRAHAAGLPMIPIDLRGYTGACSALYGGIVKVDEDGTKLAPTWHHRPHTALNTAADIAARRSTGDAAWAWGRRASSASISPLEAATLSTWGVDNLPERIGLQVF